MFEEKLVGDLNIWLRSVQFITRKCKESGTATDQSKHGCPPEKDKLCKQSTIIIDAAVVNLEEL